MRFLRKLLIGAVLAGALSVALAGVASAQISRPERIMVGTSQCWEWPATAGDWNFSENSDNPLLNVVAGTGLTWRLYFQSDGNLVLYWANSVQLVSTLAVLHSVWQSGTYQEGATRFTVQADGNMVVYRADTPLWQSGTYGTHAPDYRLCLAPNGLLSHLWLSQYGFWITDWQV